jgi:NADH:ubiquinone oxidoreductase subunit 5 (subunit L)/multisubunit Na+/H+ antiporter MnhA subunit
MPWTARALLLGAVALAALPPLNGFVSKWLIYLGLMRAGFTSDDGGLLALFAIGLLASIGGLTAIAFVRLTGIALLGSPRSDAAREAHESSPWLLGPIYVLVFSCLMVAVTPRLVSDTMSATLDQLLGPRASEELRTLEITEAPIGTIGGLNAWTLMVVVLGGIVFSRWSRAHQAAPAPTWGCGYVRPTERMQYTGRSFAEMMAEQLLPRFLRPQTQRHAPRDLFPAKSDFHAECPDPVSEEFYLPFFHRWGERFSRLRILQQGKVNVYLLYIAVMVVVVLTWVSLRTWWMAT